MEDGQDAGGPEGSLGGRLAHLREGARIGLAVQVLVVISLIILGSMAGLGYWLNTYIRNVEARTAADISAAHMTLMFEPVLVGVDPPELLPAEAARALDTMLLEEMESYFLEAAIIWWLDGSVAYSTEESDYGRTNTSVGFREALGGKPVATFVSDMTNHAARTRERMGQPLLEVYAPLYDRRTGQLAAVGEFYQNATQLQAQVRYVAFRTWAIVGATTLAMLALLLFVAHRAWTIVSAQRDELAQRLAESARLARQNAVLHRSAQNARLSAFKSNEDYLNQIGSDLHDGPIQLLTLIMLRLGIRSAEGDKPRREGRGADQTRTIDLVQQTIGELRNLAFGLAVPELDNLSVEDTLLLAIRRHEKQTGTSVEARLVGLPEQLPLPLKVCLYRVVQEALNNAFKHAGGQGQRVAAGMDAGRIEVAISDSGPGMTDSPETGGTLGILGLARRVQTFGGSLEVASQPGQGTTVVATLPIGEAAS